MNKIAICLSSDNNYTQHLGAVIASVLKNKNENEYINFYIIDGGISEQNKEKLNSFKNNFSCEIEYVKPDLEKLKNCSTFRGDYITIATYYRLLIPELVNKEDRIIYLDCDIIVRHSLNDLYNKNFNNNLVLGVIDVTHNSHSKRLNIEKYINAGVLLMNIKQMREEKTTDKIFTWIESNKDKIKCHDQDIINAVLNDRIGYIEDIYNAQVRRKNLCNFDKIKDPVILHFISPKKPWTLWKPLNSTSWANEYFTSLENTPWENFIKEYKLKSFLIFPLKLFYPIGFFRNLLRNIFSVTNTSDRGGKIIKILGFKIKIKKNGK